MLENHKYQHPTAPQGGRGGKWKEDAVKLVVCIGVKEGGAPGRNPYIYIYIYTSVFPYSLKGGSIVRHRNCKAKIGLESPT